MTIHKSIVTWEGKRYRFEVDHDRVEENPFVEYFNLHGRALSLETDEVVARVKAALIDRPADRFYEQMDAISQECESAAASLCDTDGTVKFKHPELEKDDEAAWDGGFLYVDEVEVEPSHQGQALGLRLLHEVMIIPLEIDWTLAVTMPVAFRRDICHFKNNGLHFPENEHAFLHDDDDEEDSVDYEAEEAKKAFISKSNEAMKRYICRMGFVQAGEDENTYPYWFLTPQMLLTPQMHNEALTAGSKTSGNPVLNSWLTKSEAAEVQVYEPLPKPQPPRKSKLDRKLLKAVERCGESAKNDEELAKIQSLVKQGASISNSRALFVAAALRCSPGQDNHALKALLRLGGNVNEPDEHGSRPLHIAAAKNCLASIRILVGIAKADVSVINESGQTPLQCWESHSCGGEGMGVFGPQQVLNSLTALLNTRYLMLPVQRDALVDEWMSPRMWLRLHKAAKLEVQKQKERIKTLFESTAGDVLLPLAECCHPYTGIRRIEFIPPSIISQNESGLSRSFAEGWVHVFDAIRVILDERKTPTFQRILDYIETGQVTAINADDYGKFQHFVEKGGKIAFALDALLAMSMHLSLDDDVAELPENPLDRAFDIAYVQCIDKEGVKFHETRGPYRHDAAYATEGDDESDEMDTEEDEDEMDM